MITLVTLDKGTQYLPQGLPDKRPTPRSIGLTAVSIEGTSYLPGLAMRWLAIPAFVPCRNIAIVASSLRSSDPTIGEYSTPDVSVKIF